MSKLMPSRGNIDYTQHTGAKGGAALGRTRDFLKEPSPFQTDSGPGAKQDYDKSGKAGALAKTEGDKCLKTVKPRG
jgi:hypothetical protein